MNHKLSNFEHKGQPYFVLCVSSKTLAVVLIRGNPIVFIVPIPDEDILFDQDQSGNHIENNPADLTYSLENNPLCRYCITPTIQDGRCEICNRDY